MHSRKATHVLVGSFGANLNVFQVFKVKSCAVRMHWKLPQTLNGVMVCNPLLWLQDIKLANAAAWNNLGAANEEDNGQKGAEEEEEVGDPMWNTFQSRDDIEREKVSNVTAIPASVFKLQVTHPAFRSYLSTQAG